MPSSKKMKRSKGVKTRVKEKMLKDFGVTLTEEEKKDLTKKQIREEEKRRLENLDNIHKFALGGTKQVMSDSEGYTKKLRDTLQDKLGAEFGKDKSDANVNLRNFIIGGLPKVQSEKKKYERKVKREQNEINKEAFREDVGELLRQTSLTGYKTFMAATERYWNIDGVAPEERYDMIVEGMKKELGQLAKTNAEVAQLVADRGGLEALVENGNFGLMDAIDIISIITGQSLWDLDGDIENLVNFEKYQQLSLLGVVKLNEARSNSVTEALFI